MNAEELQTALEALEAGSNTKCTHHYLVTGNVSCDECCMEHKQALGAAVELCRKFSSVIEKQKAEEQKLRVLMDRIEQERDYAHRMVLDKHQQWLKAEKERDEQGSLAARQKRQIANLEEGLSDEKLRHAIFELAGMIGVHSFLWAFDMVEMLDAIARADVQSAIEWFVRIKDYISHLRANQQVPL